MRATQLVNYKAISRAQLPLLPAKVNGVFFTQLLFEWFNSVIDEEQKWWFPLNGKELRAVCRCGSIQSGHPRGEVVVSAVAHQYRQVVVQTYYRGIKESERPAVATLIKTQHLAHQKFTDPAKRLTRPASNPTTLKLVKAAKGKCVVGLNHNHLHSYRTGTLPDLFIIADYERVDAQSK